MADLQKLHALAEQDNLLPPYSVHSGILYYKQRIYISSQSALRLQLLEEYHSSHTAGHSGADRTFRRLASSFFWLRMRQEVKQFVAACHVCQTTKYSTQKTPGLLQPLPIPAKVWDELSMDFITGLPPSKGNSVILTVVDRLTKYVHFGALPVGYDAPKVASLFVEIVVKHHGIPSVIITDRDTVFMSTFWQELFKLSGTKLKHTTAYHPQTDGQTEVMNRGIEQYLRAFTSERPTRWVSFPPWAELSMNCTYHESINMPPFRALYECDPPPLIPSQPASSRLLVVEELLTERVELLRDLKTHLGNMQQRMRAQANKHRRDLSFAVGDWILLKLQPYRQYSVARPISAKLARRYYEPFQVVEKIGSVAYRLLLPESARIHNVFHVSLLKPYIQNGPAPLQSTLPHEFVKGRPLATPTAAIRARTILVHGVPEE